MNTRPSRGLIAARLALVMAVLPSLPGTFPFRLASSSPLRGSPDAPLASSSDALILSVAVEPSTGLPDRDQAEA